MAHSFSDYESNYNLVQTITKFTEEQAVNVGIFLQESAASDAEQNTQYRPYWVIARLFEQSLKDQRISSADGAAFTGLQRPIVSYMDTQRALDLKYGWVVPTGFEALTAGEELPLRNATTTWVSNVSVF
ncbi:MAG: hypothetical protein ICV85_12765 [Tolypothrix sp. T3-bin4]|nr:hypothetical protein [Tolypothrix sp. Co-bin9]MBD0303004.1 hypothetical protein [Tolypothrix sp. T3-bin4]